MLRAEEQRWGTGCSPAEWISSALRRCQEDKWAVCFCWAKALRHLWQNDSFCTAGQLSVTHTHTHTHTHSHLAFLVTDRSPCKVGDPACVGASASRDVSAQCSEGSEAPAHGAAHAIYCVITAMCGRGLKLCPTPHHGSKKTQTLVTHKPKKKGSSDLISCWFALPVNTNKTWAVLFHVHLCTTRMI